ncbi:MAG: 4-(cytidine 5'-diphospho)-2-C-methyl-D-erythritol kinase [Alphaproteobacteria bacterium]|nr:4-(cytidine 5'-diphospho)-2-C-methyl-D-erythritol kinase [Alphaproteobacteria bacterium]MBU1514061.1 4-(cytidine 5'-diphospho)-2-C-methyl-D-erythritol kinase [Alphaproteobacteria bacterium]MBU2092999.1 4-(cytidine 5'-diphospho)-2-C-methyl-D-erythritol kinase [Alphaproteobacteria bacterium]MBU2151798.1 4-(cytidine 5'-diphospho)-2-C-methyl-D-erythritol kinase [Alphaproteobacteria bacterium]MBU2309382.1 4-(cytidine 5'-diphospho)-2-C-methyl-D-erythritol kinase [Alphaproteobacteria bacterium]
MAARLAPAKVNLFLHVGAPGADGYHPICSLMVFADFGDRVTIDLGEGSLAVIGPFAKGLGRESDNLVIKAVRAFVAELGRPMSELAMSLDKQLPVASGLGGGSSDAGAALRLIREVFAPQIDDARLEAVAAGLGADGAACLWARPVIAEGRGERLSPAPGLPQLDCVLVNPGVAVSTPDVYRRLDASTAFGDVTPPPMPDAFESVQEVAAWLTTTSNDLEAPAIEAAPEVGAVLAILRDEPETLLARVSGSGGTCFALCADDMAAETLAERIQAMAPHWWVRRCRLGGPWD